MFKFFQVCLLFFGLSALLGAQTPIRLGAVDYAPFVKQENGAITGTAVISVTDHLKALGYTPVLTFVPTFARAVELMRTGDLDGFLVGSRNSERDEIAVFSKPLYENPWVWVSRLDNPIDPVSPAFKASVVGAFSGSNQHRWLSSNGYTQAYGVTDLDSLPRMLDSGRLNAVLIAREVFATLADGRRYNLVHHSNNPLGVYFTKAFLARHPDLVTRFNARF